MYTKPEILSFLSSHKQLFKDKYSVCKMALFGSYARGDNSELSDIDILVEFDENINHIFDTKFELREFLKTSFQKDIDLCREKSLRDPFKLFILKEAIYV
jgi:uncharacterized protein